jgi:class 3 adenylate cyclase
MEAPEQAALAAGEHRKTTTIFVHLMGVDDLIAHEGPLVALNELDKYVSAVVRLGEKYGGFLAGNDIYTEGVKLILVFGAPVAREDDAANALRLALKYAASWRNGSPHSAPIGINTGFVFAGDVGSSYRREYTSLVTPSTSPLGWAQLRPIRYCLRPCHRGRRPWFRYPSFTDNRQNAAYSAPP